MQVIPLIIVCITSTLLRTFNSTRWFSADSGSIVSAYPTATRLNTQRQENSRRRNKRGNVDAMSRNDETLLILSRQRY